MTAVRDELLASSPAARVKQPGVPRTGGHHLSIAEVAYALLLRLLVATSLRRGEALGPALVGRRSHQRPSAGSVALSHGSTGTWSLVSPRRSAHALTCPSPPRLWGSWVGQGEPSGRAGQGGLDLVLDGPRVHHGERDGSRPQERTAGDQRRGQGFGHQRCRPAQVEARHSHARGRRAAAYRLGATRALLRRSHRRRVRPPSTEGVPSAVQRLSAAMGW